MEYHKIVNLLDTKSDTVPRYVTRKWVEVHDQSGGSYTANKDLKHHC